MKRYKNLDLKEFNTFGISAIADDFVVIEKYEDLKELFNEGIFNQKYFLLGGGSDLLFRSNYNGAVIKIELKGKSVINETESEAFVEVFAGEAWDELVDYTVEKDLGGLENLSLIPGLTGASPVQNIGAYGVEAKDYIETVEVFDLIKGEFFTLSNFECKFGYRDSIFKNELAGKVIVTKVIYKLTKKHDIKANYPDVIQEIEKRKLKVEELTIKDLREMIIAIRKRKLPDPIEIGNAGSFFKNPIIKRTLGEELKIKYPDIKLIDVSEEEVKVPAAWLIEKAGWKGWRSENGNYGVSEKHALVLVNYGSATGEEIYNLAQKIKANIEQNFGIKLVEEVVVI